jgi:hypothetical protein
MLIILTVFLKRLAFALVSKEGKYSVIHFHISKYLISERKPQTSVSQTDLQHSKEKIFSSISIPPAWICIIVNMHRFEFQKAISRIAAFLLKKCEIDFDLWIKFDRAVNCSKVFSREKIQRQEGNFSKMFKADLFQK